MAAAARRRRRRGAGARERSERCRARRGRRAPAAGGGRRATRQLLVLPAVQCAPAGLTADADATEWLLRRNTKLPLALLAVSQPAAGVRERCSPRRGRRRRRVAWRRKRAASGRRRARARRRLLTPRAAARARRRARRRPPSAPLPTARGRTTPRGSARRAAAFERGRLVQLGERSVRRDLEPVHARHHRRLLRAELQAEPDACAITPSTPTRTMRRSTHPAAARGSGGVPHILLVTS